MAEFDLNLVAWGAVIAGIIATAFWRVLGVLLYHKIAQNSPLMQLINMLAYSLVGAVMMLLMITVRHIGDDTNVSSYHWLHHRHRGAFCNQKIANSDHHRHWHIWYFIDIF